MATKLPIGRLLAEGFVVVGSILLAFSIDAWWDGRGQREQERVVLTALLQELYTNSDILDRNMEFQDASAKLVATLLETAAVPEPSISTDSLDHLLALVSGWSVPGYERAALEATLRGQGLAVVRNQELRRRIAGWQLALERTAEVEAQELHYALEIWMPFLRENAYVPQIWNVGSAKDPGWQTSETPTRGKQDHTGLLQSREFVNVLLERKMVHEDILLFQRLLRRTLDGFIRLLEEELGVSERAS